MKIVIPFLLAVVGLFNFNPQAKAEVSLADRDEALAMQAAVNARNTFVRALVSRDYIKVSHMGFDQTIRELADQLRAQNAAEDADELIQKWEADEMNFESNLFALGFADLGDHAPLFTWIESYLVNLENKFGAIISKLPIVVNVRTLNFAIPIVFQPNGTKTWEKSGIDNRIEYRKHFIPFANIITYYGALYGCKAIAIRSQVPQLKQLCPKAATKLQFVMGRYIAAPISDWLFKMSHRNHMTPYTVTQSQLVYRDGDDLARAIRKEMQ